MGDFQKLYDDYNGKGLNVMMINGTDGMREKREDADNFMSKEGYSMPVFYDEALGGRDGLDIEQSANVAYHINAYPTTMFIDKGGNIAGVYTGPLDEENLKKISDFILQDENIGKSLAEAFQ